MIIRDAEGNDSAAIHDILNESATWLAARGMNHWLGFHTPAWVEQAMQKMTVRIAECGRVAGIVMFRRGTIKDLQALDFHPLNDRWKAGNGQHLWVSKLAVSPAFHSQGVGSALLRDAESSTEGLALEVSRLDAVKCFAALRTFYEHRGYLVVGEHHNCFVFEKHLDHGENSHPSRH